MDEDQVALIDSEKKHPPDKHLAYPARFAATENSEKEQVLREADFKVCSVRWCHSGVCALHVLSRRALCRPRIQLCYSNCYAPPSSVYSI